MSDPPHGSKPDRPALPRDAFRAQRGASDSAGTPAPTPVIITPDYDDQPLGETTSSAAPGEEDFRGKRGQEPIAARPARSDRRKSSNVGRNPFDAYGERSSSRPYALRLPDPIDLVLRQMAAEERTQPLRIVDRILYEHLKRIGRLPPPRGT